MKFRKIRYVEGEGVELEWTTEAGDTQVKKWEAVEYEHKGQKYAGIQRVGDVWCYLGNGPRLSFHYDVAAPDEFNAPAAIADAEEAQLIEWARAAWGVPAKPPLQPVEA